MLKSTSLLLLCAPPSEITVQSISDIYGDSLINAITTSKKLSVVTDLVVAVDWPLLYGRLSTPRAQIFRDAQKLLGCLYCALHLICIKFNSALDPNLPGSVDARIIMLDCSSEYNNDVKPELSKNGPLFYLQDLVHAPHAWKEIFYMDNTEGRILYHKFLEIKRQKSNLIPTHVTCGTVVSDQLTFINSNTSSGAIHSVVAVGGTFDHLHAGHKLLLTAMALLLQRSTNSPSNLRLIIGITGDELLKNKKFAEFMRSWEHRQEDVVEFILAILSFSTPAQKDIVQSLSYYQPGEKNRIVQTRIEPLSILIECIEIQDPFGPTISDQEITALVVSSESRSGGNAVNQRRIEMGWKPLEVFEVDVLSNKEANCEPDDKFTSKISSTEIRRKISESNYLADCK